MKYRGRHTMKWMLCLSGLLYLSLCTGTFVHAEADATISTSTIQEAPFACAVLDASLTPSQARQANTSPDTARIQQALSLCSPGKAVVLRRAGQHTAFLSGPLLLPRAVTLLVDSDTTLFASRNLRDYDLSPGSCGAPVRDAKVPQCKPFLFSYQAVFSGVMGEGTIDGQATPQDFKPQPVTAPNLVSVYESQGFHLEGITLRNARGMAASIYKTIGLHASGIRIESAVTNTAAGMLLSNTQAGYLENIWIQAHGNALALQGSILGSTSNMRIHSLHLFGGGFSLGDNVYGNVKSVAVQDISIEDAPVGLRFNLTGHKTGAIHDVQIDGICLSHVAQPVQTTTAGGTISALPPSDTIALTPISVVEAKNADITPITPNTTAHCSPLQSWPSRPLLSVKANTSHLSHPGKQHRIIVALDGSGDFASVQQAVDALPDTGGEILVRPGTYRESVTIRKPHVLLRGTAADPSDTTIIENASPRNGGTFSTPTVFVEADNVSVENLTISNDLGFGKGQAVALWTNGDRDAFRSVRLLGSQDTLYASAKYCYGDYGPCVPARQYFSNCYIAGNVDFIFGDSIAFFDRCELHGMPRGNVMFTAQSKHTASQNSGYVFNDCRLTAAPRGADGKGTISLGRPWRPYAKVVYLHPRIDADVVRQGWTEWPRFGVPSLPTAYYAEYESTGPGANPTEREPYSHQLTAVEAARYSVTRFLRGKDGWTPQAIQPAAVVTRSRIIPVHH